MIIRHEKRKLPLAVAHLTSPGFVDGRSRQELSLRGGGPSRVITDVAVLGFDPKTHAVSLLSLASRDSTGRADGECGIPIHIPSEIPKTPLPTAEKLRLLREEIDPKGVHLK